MSTKINFLPSHWDFHSFAQNVMPTKYYLGYEEDGVYNVINFGFDCRDSYRIMITALAAREFIGSFAENKENILLHHMREEYLKEGEARISKLDTNLIISSFKSSHLSPEEKEKLLFLIQNCPKFTEVSFEERDNRCFVIIRGDNLTVWDHYYYSAALRSVIMCLPKGRRYARESILLRVLNPIVYKYRFGYSKKRSKEHILEQYNIQSFDDRVEEHILAIDKYLLDRTCKYVDPDFCMYLRNLNIWQGGGHKGRTRTIMWNDTPMQVSELKDKLLGAYRHSRELMMNSSSIDDAINNATKYLDSLVYKIGYDEKTYRELEGTTDTHQVLHATGVSIACLSKYKNIFTTKELINNLGKTYEMVLVDRDEIKRPIDLNEVFSRSPNYFQKNTNRLSYIELGAIVGDQKLFFGMRLVDKTPESQEKVNEH